MAIRYESRVEPIPGSDRVQQRIRADQIVIESNEHHTLVGFAENLAGATLHGLIIKHRREPLWHPECGLQRGIQ